MKNFLLIFFLILSNVVFSQSEEKSIILRDSETNLPIEDATIYIAKTKQTVLSNSEGVANFVLKGASSIQITHSSYTRTTLRSTSLKANKNVVLLKNAVNNLEEIIITNQHPQKILKSLVDNSIKKLTIPGRLKVYSRELFKLNDEYKYFNDGLVNFQLFGKEGGFKSTILVEQNRSFGVTDGEYLTPELLGYNLNNVMENYYNFKYLNLVLDVRAKKEFDFLMKTYTINKEYNVMLITPTDESKGLFDDYKIVYDPKKKLIIEVSSSISPVTLSKFKEKTAVGSKNIFKSLFKTIYRYDGSTYYLINSKEEIGFERIDKNKTTRIEVRNYFVTTNFSEQTYSHSESDVFKDKTLLNKKNVILSKYWDVSGLTPTEEEQKILDIMEGKSY